MRFGNCCTLNKSGRSKQPEVCILRNGALRFTAYCYRPATPVPVRGSVLMLHGFPDTPHTFAPLVPALLEAGYQVVLPVMRGYQPSSIPGDGNLQMAAIAADVVAWLDQEPLAGQPVHLVGHDWGAVAGYATAGLAGDRLVSFSALAIPPVGNVLRRVWRVPRQVLLFWYQFLALLPGIAERCFSARNFALPERLWRRWSPGLEPPPALLEAMRAHFRLPGVLTAALRYYRSLYSYHRPGRWKSEKLFCAPVRVPVLILNGLDDGCIDTRLFAYCINEEQFSAGVHHHALTGCGHWLHLERGDEVLGRLLAHFAASEAPDSTDVGQM